MGSDDRHRVSDRVHDGLRRAILEGTLAPGAAVPSERALAEEHGVNRHAVREALKRLEQAGLIQITHGGATRVLDWRDGAGLEVLLDLVSGPPGGEPPPELVRSVLEMRASIGVDAARRCGERGETALRERVAVLAEEAAGAVGGPEEELDLRYAVLWRAIVEGSGNVAYRLALNSLMGALGAYADVAARVRPRDPEAVRTLGGAIGRGDGQAAEAVARTLLGDATFTAPPG
jgi:DNA-binding FadR family transcriptional regulator